MMRSTRFFARSCVGTRRSASGSTFGARDFMRNQQAYRTPEFRGLTNLRLASDYAHRNVRNVSCSVAVGQGRQGKERHMTHSSIDRAPGPRGLPWFGSVFPAWRDPLALFLESRDRYGDVVRFRFG